MSEKIKKGHLTLVHSEGHLAGSDGKPGQPVQIGHDYLAENPVTDKYPDVETEDSGNRVQFSEPAHLTAEQLQAAEDIGELLGAKHN